MIIPVTNSYRREPVPAYSILFNANVLSTMLLPLMGFVLGCIAYIVVGLIVLACSPSLPLRLTFPNLILFVVGALLAVPVCLLAYSQMLARNQLSDAAFVGIFPALLAGGMLGGVVAVWLKERFVKKQLLRPRNLQ